MLNCYMLTSPSESQSFFIKCFCNIEEIKVLPDLLLCFRGFLDKIFLSCVIGQFDKQKLPTKFYFVCPSVSP